jgi:hypothetical protein
MTFEMQTLQDQSAAMLGGILFEISPFGNRPSRRAGDALMVDQGIETFPVPW